MSHLTLPSGVGDARFMTFLRELRDELAAVEEKQSGGGGLESRVAALESTVNTESTGLAPRVAALETTVTAEGTGLVDRVTALETPGA